MCRSRPGTQAGPYIPSMHEARGIRRGLKLFSYLN